MRRLFLLAVILAIATLPEIAVSQATRAVGTYTRYARHIRTKADSVIVLADQANRSVTSPDDISAILASAGRRMLALAGDFDAITPPADLARLHEQLGKPLLALAHKYSTIATLFAQHSGDGAHAANELIVTLPTDAKNYRDARERATRMLAEHGVTLTALPLFRDE